jgi:hypothetical protein
MREIVSDIYKRLKLRDDLVIKRVFFRFPMN